VFRAWRARDAIVHLRLGASACQLTAIAITFRETIAFSVQRVSRASCNEQIRVPGV